MTTVEQAHAAARRVVGTQTRVELGPVSPRDLGRFEVAIAGSVRGTARYGPDPRPHPLFLSSVLGWGTGPDEPDLLPDGNAPDPFAGLSLTGLRLMGGGQELTLHRDPTAGADVVMDVSIAEVTVRESRSGPLLVLIVARRYSDADGLLCECRETFLGRDEVVGA